MNKKAIQTVVLLLLCIIHCLWYQSNDVDDAYISYRYAQSLLEGHGFTFNPGQYVEGFSNPLWVLITTALLFIFQVKDPHTLIQFVGLFFSCGTLFLLLRCGHLLFPEEQRWSALFPPLLLVSQPGFAFYTMSGMETPMYLFWLSLALFFLLKNGFGFAVGCALGLAAWTRPEAPYFVFIFCLFGLAQQWMRNETIQWRKILLGFVGIGAVFGPWVLFRLYYFGELFPNTYFTKKVPLTTSIQSASAYWWRYLAKTYWLTLPAFLAALLLWKKNAAIAELQTDKSTEKDLVPDTQTAEDTSSQPEDAPEKQSEELTASVSSTSHREIFSTHFLLAGLWLGTLGSLFILGADWMPLHRFMVHLSLFEVLMLSAGFWAVATFVGRSKQWLRHSIAFVLLGFVMILQFGQSGIYASVVEELRPVHQKHFKRMGYWIRLQKEIKVVALMDIGKIAFYAKKPIIDLGGLTDKVIGKSKGTFLDKQYPVSYVFKQKPQLIIIRTDGPSQRIWKGEVTLLPQRMFGSERRLYTHPNFKKQYKYFGTMVWGPRSERAISPHYHLFRHRLVHFKHQKKARSFSKPSLRK